MDAEVPEAEPGEIETVIAPTVADEPLAPKRIMLFPAGPDIVARDGRRWLIPDPQIIVSAFAANRAAMPIDFEHAQDHKAPKGEIAPAAGWIEAVSLDEAGALWGDVRWTDRGRTSIESLEYRFFSPTFRYDPKSSRIPSIIALIGGALVNRPALYLPALAGEDRSTLIADATLIAALGLPASAGVHDALTRVAALRDDLAVARSTDRVVPREDHDALTRKAIEAGRDRVEIGQALGLPLDASGADILARLGEVQAELATARAAAEAPSIERFVPRADHETALARAGEADQVRADLGRALGLEATATAAELTARIGELQGELVTARAEAASPPIERFVPRADHETALARAGAAERQVTELTLAREDEEITRLVDGAIAEGKFSPASRPRMLALCRAEGGKEHVRGLIETTPALMPWAKDRPQLGRLTALDGRSGRGGLSADERRVCAALGLEDDAFNRARERQ